MPGIPPGAAAAAYMVRCCVGGVDGVVAVVDVVLEVASLPQPSRALWNASSVEDRDLAAKADEVAAPVALAAAAAGVVVNEVTDGAREVGAEQRNSAASSGSSVSAAVVMLTAATVVVAAIRGSAVAMGGDTV